MKVLVTGAKGMLGQDLCPLLEDYGYDVIEADLDYFDITNSYEIKKFIDGALPFDFIIHCAAYTDVEKAEDDFDKAYNINVLGTKNVANIASKYSIPFIYISTDYVFDGNKGVPYEITDITNPMNNYGLTKLKGEEVVKSICSKYFIIRTSWLYGHHGNNFVEKMISLKDKDVIKVVDDQIGSPTWTVELSNNIIQIIENNIFGTYHVCGSGFTSWYGFAKKIFQFLNIDVNIVPCKSKDFPQKAKRPAYSVLDNNNCCRKWEDALKDYLDLRMK